MHTAKVLSALSLTLSLLSISLVLWFVRAGSIKRERMEEFEQRLHMLEWLQFRVPRQ